MLNFKPGQFLLVLVLISASTQLALARDGLTPRKWQNDLDFLNSKVVESLRAEYKKYQFPPSWRVYRDAFLDGIKEERRTLDRISYQVLRDIMLTLSQDFEMIANESSWQAAEHYLETKLDLVTNLLSMAIEDD